MLLDEQIDRRLKPRFAPGVEVMTVLERGWDGLKNGDLLRAAETEFDVFVTMDKGIPHQQNLERYNLGFILLRAFSNRKSDLEPLMPALNSALADVRPGKVVFVRAEKSDGAQGSEI